MAPTKAIQMLNETKKLSKRMAENAVKMAYQEGLIARDKYISDPQCEIERIWKAIEGYTELTRKEINGESRKQDIMDIRRIVSFEIYRVYKSLKGVGRIMGRDHSTICNHLCKYRNLFATDRRFRKLALEISKIIDEQ